MSLTLDTPEPGPLEQAIDRVHGDSLLRSTGRVTRVVGLMLESQGPFAAVGDRCEVELQGPSRSVPAEVVGFRDRSLLLMPLGSTEGLLPGARVSSAHQRPLVPVASRLAGRVLDGLGRPIDGLGSIPWHRRGSGAGSVPHPLRRRRIRDPFATGVKALDTLIPCGCGQRIGIFAGSGVGKSTLLGMIAGHSDADVNVVALIGERGREVREFLETDLDEVGRAKSIVVVATADQPALLRVRAAQTAMGIAEELRGQGRSVLMLMDSVTRYAMALREVGLAVGEPPSTRGYTPSVFGRLSQLLERAGNDDRGSITGFFTVLVEGDDMNEPVADASRAILDGHIVLSRELADQNHWPAIDILQSVSRLNRDLLSPAEVALAGLAREHLAVQRQNRDLVSIGAYQAGSNRALDQALQVHPRLVAFLRQTPTEVHGRSSSWEQLRQAVSPGSAPLSPDSRTRN